MSPASRRHAVQGWTVAWLTLVWWVLWGTWSLLSLVGGVLLAVVVLLVFPLPRLQLRLRVRPWGVVVLVARLVVDILVATVDVARVTLFPPSPLRNGLVEVHLASNSDLVQTVVAELVSLVPGSVVVEVHRVERSLYLHVLDVRDPADLDRARARVLAQEARVLRAFAPDPVPALEEETA